MSNAAMASTSADDTNASTSRPAQTNGASASTSAPALAAATQDTTRDVNSRLAYVPRDARLMALILQSMGVEDVQPPALMMLLEFAQRYLYEVLQDALVYADHANSAKASSSGVSTLTADDVQLAIQARVNHSFTGPPSKDMLLSLASSLNNVPLPPISDKHGVKLPPDQHCLTNVNFSIVPDLPHEDEDADGEEEEEVVANGSETARKTTELADDDDDASAADDDMDDVSAAAAAAAANEADNSAVARGTKRSLDEDDEYD